MNYRIVNGSISYGAETILEEITEVFPELTTTQIRTLLGTFLFSGEDVFKKINVLSGGERARLQLCKI